MAKSAKKSKTKKEAIVAKPVTHETTTDNEKPGAYGGIPKRDLKKNLGCG